MSGAVITEFDCEWLVMASLTLLCKQLHQLFSFWTADHCGSEPVKPTDETLKQGACAALELTARRGSISLERAVTRFTPRQLALMPAAFLETLRLEAAQLRGPTP